MDEKTQTSDRDSIIQKAIDVWSSRNTAMSTDQRVLVIARALWSMSPSMSEEPVIEDVREYIYRK